MIVHSSAYGASIPTEGADDQWGELERLATVAQGLLESGAFGDHAKQEWWDFRRATMPAEVLKLIAAARANPVGTQGEARSEPNTTTEQGTER